MMVIIAFAISNSYPGTLSFFLEESLWIPKGLLKEIRTQEIKDSQSRIVLSPDLELATSKLSQSKSMFMINLP